MNALQPVFVLALDAWAWVLIGIGGLALLIILLFVGQYFSLWLQAKLSNASVTFFSLIGMRLAQHNEKLIGQVVDENNQQRED